MKKIEITVNERLYHLEIEESWSLLYILREVLGLTGTKCGCKDGGCGACTVIMSGEAVRSCRIKGCNANGASIQTIEGVADGEKLHPLQQAFIDAGAIQCGFCTPGMIMRAKALLDKNLNPAEWEIREAMKEHVCRCCGYQKIVEAITLAAARMRGVQDGKQ